MKGIISKTAISAEKLLGQALAGWRIELWHMLEKVYFKKDPEIPEKKFVGYFPSEDLLEKEKGKIRKEEIENPPSLSTTLYCVLTMDGKTGFILDPPFQFNLSKA